MPQHTPRTASFSELTRDLPENVRQAVLRNQLSTPRYQQEEQQTFGQQGMGPLGIQDIMTTASQVAAKQRDVVAPYTNLAGDIDWPNVPQDVRQAYNLESQQLQDIVNQVNMSDANLKMQAQRQEAAARQIGGDSYMDLTNPYNQPGSMAANYFSGQMTDPYSRYVDPSLINPRMRGNYYTGGGTGYQMGGMYNMPTGIPSFDPYSPGANQFIRDPQTGMLVQNRGQLSGGGQFTRDPRTGMLVQRSGANQFIRDPQTGMLVQSPYQQITDQYGRLSPMDRPATTLPGQRAAPVRLQESDPVLYSKYMEEIKFKEATMQDYLDKDEPENAAMVQNQIYELQYLMNADPADRRLMEPGGSMVTGDVFRNQGLTGVGGPTPQDYNMMLNPYNQTYTGGVYNPMDPRFQQYNTGRPTPTGDPRAAIDRFPSSAFPTNATRMGGATTAGMGGFPDLSGIGGGLLDFLSRLTPGVLASMVGAPPKHEGEEPSSTFHLRSDPTPHQPYEGVKGELRNIGGPLRDVLGWPFMPDQPPPPPQPQPSFPSGQPQPGFERSPVPQPQPQQAGPTVGDDGVSRSVVGEENIAKMFAEMRAAKEVSETDLDLETSLADALAGTTLSPQFIKDYAGSAQGAFQTGKLDLDFLLQGEKISTADLYTVVESMTNLITDFREQQMELSRVYTGGDPTQETYAEREMTEREAQGYADRIAQGLGYQVAYQNQQENVRSAKEQEDIAREQIEAAGTRATEQQKNDLTIAQNRTASEEKVQKALEEGRMTRYTGEMGLGERALTEQERASREQEYIGREQLRAEERGAIAQERLVARELTERERSALAEEGLMGRELTEQERAALISEGFSLRQIEEIERSALKEEAFRGRELTETEARTKIAEDAQAETIRAAKAEEAQAEAELTAAGTMATAENTNRLDVAKARVEGEAEVAEIQTAANKLMHENEISERQADRTVEKSRIANEKKIALKTIKSTEGIDEARRDLETSLQEMQDARGEKERELQSALNTANISQAEKRRLSDVSDEANRLSEQVLERELRESLGLAELTETRLVREQKLQIAQLEDTLARDLQNVGVSEAQIDRILQFELAVMEQQTQLMQAQLANPYAAAVMQQMAGGVSPFAQGLGELGVGIPGISTEQTGLEAIFPGGIPTIGALSQADPETLNYLNALLGFSGITPEQFGMAASEVTPQAGQAAFGRAGQRPGRFISRI